ncbi:MAG TPA: hypothetical protein VNZ49_08935 [Bacteroidia bacterium]|jgi:hypothetical protein|nr:hypothetical protein [Bacteroidia bacterium]
MTTGKVLKAFAMSFVLLITNSCEKPAGPGGKATIKGKLYAKNFDSYGTSVISEYYIAGENVFICYGTNNGVGNNVRTSTDGSFEFLYLNKGHYKIFANSRDTSIHVKNSKKTIPVIMELDISSTTQTSDVGIIVINK